MAAIHEQCQRPMGVITTALLALWPDNGRRPGHPGGCRTALSDSPDAWTRCLRAIVDADGDALCQRTDRHAREGDDPRPPPTQELTLRQQAFRRGPGGQSKGARVTVVPPIYLAAAPPPSRPAVWRSPELTGRRPGSRVADPGYIRTQQRKSSTAPRGGGLMKVPRGDLRLV